MPHPSSSHRPPQVAVILDGDPPIGGWSAALGHATVVVAADGGARHARREGVAVDHLVGDLDSIESTELERLRADGTRVHSASVDKDETDFELALDLALELLGSPPGAEVLVVGGSGGRLDHLLAIVAVLSGPRLAGHRVRALMGDALVQPLGPGRPVSLFGPRGSIVSLLPVGGPTHGVTTTGLAFPLWRATLASGTARGTSNRIESSPTGVEVGAGTLLVTQPSGVRPFIAHLEDQP